MPGPLFRSAFTRPDVTPAEVLKFHRSIFGATRMEADPAPSTTDPAPPPAPAPVPAPPAPAPSTDPVDSDKGYPADTPLAEMTVEQREAYWKHQARKHEGTVKARANYDEILAENARLKQANETEHERAVREAREQGATEARQSAANETVAAMLRMGLRARGVDGDDLEEAVSTINLGAHANEQGVVDDEKVLRTINRLAGTASSSAGPDTGQGNRGQGETRPSSVAQVMAARQAARAAKN